MTGRQVQNSDRERRRGEAATWHARLEMPDAAVEDWAGFTEWLEAEPANRAAYDEIELLAVELRAHEEQLRTLTRPSTAGIVDFSAEKREDKPRFLAGKWLRPLIVAAAAALLVVIGVQQYQALSPDIQTYNTGPGERRVIALSDGSTLRLNAMTKVTAHIDGDERQLTLDTGEALFEVAHDAARPFVVSVAGQEVRDVGTTFNILSHPQGMTVTVVQGQVDVGPAHSGADTRLRIERGRQLVYDQAADRATVRTVNAENVTAWRDGRLVYDNAPLSEVAVDVSRYIGKPVIPDSKASHLRFTGVLILGKEAEMLNNLEALVPVTVKNSAQGVDLIAR